jgi:hypothetical protein
LFDSAVLSIFVSSFSVFYTGCLAGSGELEITTGDGESIGSEAD